MEKVIVKANFVAADTRKWSLRKILPLLAVACAMAIGIAAGIWQTNRAHEKEGLEQKLQMRSRAQALHVAPEASTETQLSELEFQQLRIKGEFLANWPIYLENRPLNGKVGFYVLMPFKLAAVPGQAPVHVLVARGWVARDTRDRRKLPEIATPQGEIEITGMIRRQAGRLLQLGRSPEIKPRAILQNMEIADFAAASQLQMRPYLLEQSEPVTPADGLRRDWPRASSGVDKHRGYAFQWFGLATAAFFYYVYLGFRRARRSNPRNT